jgi:Ca2+-binding RTX toxin-like protein
MKIIKSLLALLTILLPYKAFTANLTVYQPINMNNMPWFFGAVYSTPYLIEVYDGYSEADYYGTFKYKNGDISSGTVNRFDYFEGGIRQYSMTSLKLNAKKVELYVNSGNTGALLSWALSGNDIISATAVTPNLGSGYDNVLNGYNGNDTIYCSNGIDYVDAGIGNDTVYGVNGENTIFGRNGDDIIYGGNGTDWTYGENGNDKISGGIGDDWINGGLGKNTLTGGVGVDYYDFNTKIGGSNKTTILDFVSGLAGDFLMLDSAIFTSLSSTAFGADNFVIGTKALDENDYLIFNPKTQTLSYDADGIGVGKAVPFVILSGVTTLYVNNIHVY